MIIETIQKSIEESLLSSTSSRTYYTQSLLSSASASSLTSTGSVKDTKIYDYKLVRTDSKEKKLDAFVFPKPLADVLPGTAPVKSLADSEQVYRKARKPIHLTSVLSLQNEIKKSKHNGY